MTINAKARVYPHSIRRHAERAITRRLGYHDPNAIISVKRDTETPGVILHVNSGGNSIACETALRHAGYRVECVPKESGTYGELLRVTPSK